MATHRYKTRVRIENPGDARLLNFACFHNQALLNEPRLREIVLQAIDRARDQHHFKLWAFVIMPDHVHLLMLPQGAVAPILQSIKQSAARRIVNLARSEMPDLLKAMHDPAVPDGGSHRLWQRGGGFDRNLRTPKAVWEAIDYIHMNPVRAGLCALPGEWEWSSAGEYGGSRSAQLTIDREGLPPRSV
ncbi:MAG: transposase [Phycisphaerales bacterium JB037]